MNGSNLHTIVWQNQKLFIILSTVYYSLCGLSPQKSRTCSFGEDMNHCRGDVHKIAQNMLKNADHTIIEMMVTEVSFYCYLYISV